MTYTCTIDIDLPRERVAELLNDQNNLSEWLDGFISVGPLSGEPGEVGAVSKFRFKMGKGEVEMTETITKKQFPDEYEGKYDAPKMENWVNNRLEVIDEHKTRWVQHTEFKFQGFMKVVAAMMPRSFKKRSMLHMRDFKAFAEKRG